MSPARKYPCGQAGCDRKFETAAGAGRHRRTAHGIPGKHRPVEVPGFRLPDGVEPAKRGRPPKADPLAIDIIATHLFPKGVPAAKIPQFLEWVDMTRKLVEK